MKKSRTSADLEEEKYGVDVEKVIRHCINPDSITNYHIFLLTQEKSIGVYVVIHRDGDKKNVIQIGRTNSIEKKGGSLTIKYTVFSKYSKGNFNYGYMTMIPDGICFHAYLLSKRKKKVKTRIIPTKKEITDVMTSLNKLVKKSLEEFKRETVVYPQTTSKVFAS